jgi:hypothetical protein
MTVRNASPPRITSGSHRNSTSLPPTRTLPSPRVNQRQRRQRHIQQQEPTGTAGQDPKAETRRSFRSCRFRPLGTRIRRNQIPRSRTGVHPPLALLQFSAHSRPSKSWCTGEDSNLRSSKERQIYSLLPLTTRPPVPIHPSKQRSLAFLPALYPLRRSAPKSHRLTRKITGSQGACVSAESSPRPSPAPGKNSGASKTFCRFNSEFHFPTVDSAFLQWSWRRDLNPRPSDYKSDALPAELRQPIPPGNRPGDPKKRTGTPPLRPYYGTEIKVSTPPRTEQTGMDARGGSGTPLPFALRVLRSIFCAFSLNFHPGFQDKFFPVPG